MNFEFNKDRIVENIRSLGGTVKVNSSSPGVYISKDGESVSVMQVELFPYNSISYHEENLLRDVQVDKDKETSNSFSLSTSANSFPKNLFTGAA
ncbi:hypothetical protein RMT88_18575 [Bacillus altitudinis]|uniref:hypothetical protein n=1 Tax=Bacillus altitudinis TaxID=293387 RepID=UPI0028873374|nr:hypothetical protein [Bacillus altitudinis]MDT1122032.1 hypothetical protein [Bacillus altitudinis]